MKLSKLCILKQKGRKTAINSLSYSEIYSSCNQYQHMILPNTNSIQVNGKWCFFFLHPFFHP